VISFLKRLLGRKPKVEDKTKAQADDRAKAGAVEKLLKKGKKQEKGAYSDNKISGKARRAKKAKRKRAAESRRVNRQKRKAGYNA